MLAAPGGDAVPGPRAGRPGPQGRVREAAPGARAEGVRPRADRRRGPRPVRADPAPEELQAHDRGRGRPAGRQAGHPSPGRRLDRDRARADRGPGRDRRPDPRRRGRADVQPIARVHVRRPLVRRAAAAELLVQLAVRRVPDLRRARDAARGRLRSSSSPTRTCRSREGALAPWSSARLEYWDRVLDAVAESQRVLDDDAVEEALEGGEGRRALRLERRDPRPVQEPVRTDPLVLDDLRGRRPGRRAAPRRDRLREPARTARGVHARDPVPRVRGSAPAAGEPGGHGGRTEHLRAHRPVDPRHPLVHRRGRPERARADDRRTAAEGDPRTTAVPRRRRARLPVPVARLGDARRWRGAAHPARDPDRERPRRRPLHPRRAVDRPAPARQPATARHPRAAARPREHAHRRRARRGDDRGGRPPRGHRARAPGMPAARSCTRAT